MNVQGAAHKNAQSRGETPITFIQMDELEIDVNTGKQFSCSATIERLIPVSPVACSSTITVKGCHYSRM